MTLAELKVGLGRTANGVDDAHLTRLLAAAEADVEARAANSPQASKERTVVLLCALDIAHRPGIRSRSVGRLTIEYSTQYDRERERLLRSLTRGRGARLLVGGKGGAGAVTPRTFDEGDQRG